MLEPRSRSLATFAAGAVALVAALLAPAAQAAGLAFTVSTLTPAARPTVVVTVSGAEVFNAPTTGFTIPVNTTGHVVIRIASLPAFQAFEGWTGECAGLLPSQACEFDAGQNRTYLAGAIVRNRTGTLRFTSSTVDEVRAPTALTVNQAQSPDGSTGALSVSTQPSATPLTLVIGSYSFEPRATAGAACEQSPTQTSVPAQVSEGQETVVNLAFKTDRCAITANVLAPFNGSVTSAPAGIDCPFGAPDAVTGSPCSAFFAFKSSVRLTPAPKAGFAFAGWSGCSPQLERVCSALAVQGSVKVPAFVAARAGSADLAIAATDIVASDAGGGKVRLAVTLRNLGTDTAADVRAELGSTLGNAFTEIPSNVSDGGSCNALSFCTWTLGELASGASKTVSFIAGTTRTNWPMRACTLSATADPNPANDCVSATVTLPGTPPPAPAGPAVVSIGPAPPVAGAALKAALDVPALQFTVAPPAGATASYALTGLTLTASGSGHDALDIASVKIYPDNNGNGIVDAAEKPLLVASGSFTADDGQAIINFAPTGVLNGRAYLVTVDVSNTIAAEAVQAAGMAGLAALALWGGAGGLRRRHAAAMVVLVAISLLQASCGGGGAGGGGTPVTRTYVLELTDVRVQADGLAVGAGGTPVLGAEIRVDK
jgi:hypothetical protein